MRGKFTSTLVILLFLVQPNIAQMMFLSFNCYEVDTNIRLKENIESVCYAGEHLFYLLTVIIPSVILWAIGIPLFAIFLLYINRGTFTLMKKKIITKSEE
jgi:hypothetical protein